MVFDEEEEKEGRRERYRKAAHRLLLRLQASASASGTNVRMGFNGPRHSTMVQWVKGVYERLRDLKCPITTRTGSQVPTDLRRQPQKNGSEIHTPVFKEANSSPIRPLDLKNCSRKPIQSVDASNPPFPPTDNLPSQVCRMTRLLVMHPPTTLRYPTLESMGSVLIWHM